MTRFNIFSNKCFREAFKSTIPVLLGYIAIGIAFGLLLTNAGYHWLLAPFMSITIYAGAGQYIAVSMFAQNADFAEKMLSFIGTMIPSSRRSWRSMTSKPSSILFQN